MTGYYDYVLGLIPLALFGVTGTLAGLFDLALTAAVPLGAGLALALILHAMFVRAPVDTVSVDPAPAEQQTPSAAPVNAD